MQPCRGPRRPGPGSTYRPGLQGRHQPSSCEKVSNTFGCFFFIQTLRLVILFCFLRNNVVFVLLSRSPCFLFPQALTRLAHQTGSPDCITSGYALGLVSLSSSVRNGTTFMIHNLLLPTQLDTARQRWPLGHHGLASSPSVSHLG
jgi:hypothetical protein